MWGADLDNDDRGAIKQDLARRAVSSAEASEPSNVPVGEAG